MSRDLLSLSVDELLALTLDELLVLPLEAVAIIARVTALSLDPVFAFAFLDILAGRAATVTTSAARADVTITPNE